MLRHGSSERTLVCAAARSPMMLTTTQLTLRCDSRGKATPPASPGRDLRLRLPEPRSFFEAGMLKVSTRCVASKSSNHKTRGPPLLASIGHGHQAEFLAWLAGGT